MKIALGTDHAGYDYKEAIKQHLQKHGHEVQDFGTFSNESVDYPEYIRPAAESVADGICDLGIVLGGSGNGEAMAANKVKVCAVLFVGAKKLRSWPRSTTTPMSYPLAKDKSLKNLPLRLWIPG